MDHFRRHLKQNVKKEVICYKKKLDSLDLLIKVVI